MRKKNITALFLLLFMNVLGQEHETIAEKIQKLPTVKDSNKVKLLIEIGNYYGAASRNDSNKYYLNIALEESVKCRYEWGESRALSALGYVYKFEGDQVKALDFFQKALRLKEKLHLKLEAAAVREAMGRIYLDREDPDEAIKYFIEVKKVYESFNDSSRLVPLMAQFGACYEEKKDYKSAMEYYRETIKVYTIWQQNRSTILPAAIIGNYRAAAIRRYSTCLIETGRAKEAVGILEPLYIERKKIGGATRIVTQSSLAYAYLHAGYYQKAAENCEEAIDVYQENPNLRMLNNLMDLHFCASEAYYGMGNYKKAYLAHKSFKEVNDSIFNEKANTSFTEMQAKYEAEIKDSKISDLKKEKKSQRLIIGLAVGAALIALGLLVFAYRSKRLQQKLFIQKREVLLKEKEIELIALQKKMNELEQMALRSQMNPHFIFNSLNTVQHFVMKKDVEGVNKYLGAFAQLVRQTLNNSGSQFISLDDEIKYLNTYLSLEKMKSNNRFNYIITVNENVERSTTFIPGMILQPFVENSIKHGVAHKEESDGLINIRVSKNGGLVCLVEDNGVGRQKSGEMKLMGSDAEFESKGMSITMNRIDIINKIYGVEISATIEDISDEQGNISGTKVIVNFPLDLE